MLIGVRDSGGIFEGVRWSSPETLRSQLDRAARLGRSVLMLPGWYDIDAPEDLIRHGRDISHLL